MRGGERSERGRGERERSERGRGGREIPFYTPE